MKHGKYEAPRPRRRRSAKIALTLLCVALVLSFAVGGTVAYLIRQSGTVSNQFAPGFVDCEVVDNGSTISIRNAGNVSAYLRAAVVVNWVDADGNISGTKQPQTVEVKAGWTPSGGIYYYSGAVASGQSVEFIADISGMEDDGYTLSVEVVAEAIQAEGMGAATAQDAWAKAMGAQG